MTKVRYLAGLMQARWGDQRKEILYQAFKVSSTKDVPDDIADQLITALVNNDTAMIEALLTPTTTQ